MSGDRLKEYLYILAHLRGVDENRNTSNCLFIIPSTGTWIFMDCLKVFDNVTFLCEYPKEKKNTVSPEAPEKFCQNGWTYNVYDEYCYKLEGLKDNSYITLAQLHCKCESTGSRIAPMGNSTLLLHVSDITLLRLLFSSEII